MSVQESIDCIRRLLEELPQDGDRLEAVRLVCAECGRHGEGTFACVVCEAKSAIEDDEDDAWGEDSSADLCPICLFEADACICDDEDERDSGLDTQDDGWTKG